MAGIFVEHEGASEMPTVTITNADSDGLHLMLRDSMNHEFDLAVGPEDTGSIQVPAGDYSLLVTSDSPYIHPNTGDARLRQFKTYTATLAAQAQHQPIHLGD